jgi:hypothetical protein
MGDGIGIADYFMQMLLKTIENSPMDKDVPPSKTGGMDEVVTVGNELNQVLLGRVGRCGDDHVLFVLKLAKLIRLIVHKA